ncbi:unnamed protein product [Phytophthora lilii]|uniref:Unnamed protein product n=1 Tax=Phytophthora lilii TaxID=2077276 RepID=A0A9W6U5Y8_9STRA|nr:unnamed protein product [Phytophthora lilii]
MAPDVVFNAEYGLPAMMRSWCCWQWFDDMEIKPLRLHNGVEGSHIASTRTSVTLSMRTQTNVFPHLNDNQNRDKIRRLVQRLVGQRIVMWGSTSFEWDQASSRVVSVIAQSDMLSPMLLGSLEDVAALFEKALISLDFQWRQAS